jgi:hypothetical protein
MVTTLGIGALFVCHYANDDPTIQKINTFKEAQIDFKGAILLIQGCNSSKLVHTWLYNS